MTHAKTGRPVVFPPEVGAARRIEINRRRSKAVNYANATLREKHADEWADLFNLAATDFEKQYGPLPGAEYLTQEVKEESSSPAEENPVLTKLLKYEAVLDQARFWNSDE